MKHHFIVPFLIIPLFSSCGGKPTDPRLNTPLYFTCLSDSANILICFSFDEAQQQLSDFLLESSKDNQHWSKVEPVQSEEEGKGYADISFNKNEKIYFRSDNHGYSEDFYITFMSEENDDEVSVAGNVMSLLSKTNFAKNKTLPLDACLYSLFCENNNLVDAGNLILPATTLTANCYEAMFSCCIKLKTLPKLPATSLAESCYQFMFSGCDVLASAPRLPASKLVTNCYNKMFYNCYNLSVSTEGKDENKIFTCPKGGASCCEEMFYNLTVQDNTTYYYL